MKFIPNWKISFRRVQGSRNTVSKRTRKRVIECATQSSVPLPAYASDRLASSCSCHNTKNIIPENAFQQRITNLRIVSVEHGPHDKA